MHAIKGVEGIFNVLPIKENMHADKINITQK